MYAFRFNSIVLYYILNWMKISFLITYVFHMFLNDVTKNIKNKCLMKSNHQMVKFEEKNIFIFEKEI
jgi:hypothetical protein